MPAAPALPSRDSWDNGPHIRGPCPRNSVRGGSVRLVGGQLDEVFEGGELLVVGAVELGEKRGDAGGAVEVESLGDRGLGAEQVGEAAEVERDGVGGLVAMTGLPELLDSGDLVGEAEPGEGVVVEVAAPGAHGSDREGIAPCMAAGRLVTGGIVVGDLDRDRCDEVQVGERAARGLGSLAQRTQERVRGLGDERVAEPAVGSLTGETQVGRPHGRDVDGNVGRRDERLQRAAIAVGERQRVDLARVFEPVAAAHRCE